MYFFDELIKYGNRVALVSQEGEMTYTELTKSCEYLKNSLPDEKNLVFCFCKNDFASIIGYLAFLNHKSVPLLLNKDIDEQLAMHLIETYKPKFLYNANESLLKRLKYQVIFSDSDSILVQLDNETIDMYAELALLLTTSGSTGSPKLVRQSYENIQSNADAIVEYLEIDERERAITTLPMNYTYGLSIINSHLLAGASVIVTEYSIMQKEFWELCRQKQATSFGGVPYTYEMLKKLRFFNMELPFLRTMTQAGGKLNPELHKMFAEYANKNGKKFVVMYGQTEATARMAYLPHNKAIEKFGSMGIAIPNGELWLEDEEGNKITAVEEVGELIYKGANVTLGYAEKTDDLKKTNEFKGILRTGDMAKKDADGFFYIVGRKKRFLKIYGNRVNLDEIEMMIKKHFEYSHIVCSGIDDCLYVFVEKEETDFLRAVQNFLAEKTKLNKMAFKVKHIPNIPQNEVGKVLYKKLETYYD